MSALRRLNKEFESLEKDPLDFCEVTPSEDKMSAEAKLSGPAGSPYAGGVWTVDLTFPANYPFKAPTVKFRTEIKHPNVTTATGEVCPEVFFPNWSPTMNARLVFTNMRAILITPNVETPLEPELAELFASDRPKFDALVKDHVKGLAKKKQ
jgi:ubiquitin-conjugating enzyme E2 D/E